MRAFPAAPGFRPAAAAALLTLAVDVVYLAAIHAQGNSGSRVGFVAGSLAASASAAVGAWAVPPAVRAGLLGWSAATLGAWALLGAASVGLLLVPSTALAAVATDRVLAVAAPVARLAVLAGAVGALATVAAGLVSTS